MKKNRSILVFLSTIGLLILTTSWWTDPCGGGGQPVEAGIVHFELGLAPVSTSNLPCGWQPFGSPSCGNDCMMPGNTHSLRNMNNSFTNFLNAFTGLERVDWFGVGPGGFRVPELSSLQVNTEVDKWLLIARVVDASGNMRDVVVTTDILKRDKTGKKTVVELTLPRDQSSTVTFTLTERCCQNQSTRLVWTVSGA